MNSFAALADENRRRIVELLARKGEMPVNAICSHFSISAPAVSQHLKILKETHIVQVKKKAQQRLYQLDPAGICELENWLAALADMWTARLDSLDGIHLSTNDETTFPLI